MNIIKDTLQSLYSGDLNVVYNNKSKLNDISISLINKDNLSYEALRYDD